MNLYNRFIHTGYRLKRLKRAIPYLFATTTLIALLVTTPFGIAGNSTALTLVSLSFASAGIAIRWMAGHKASDSLEDRIAAGGIYSVIRFPDYLAVLLIIAGFTVYTGIVWYAVFVFAVSWFVTERIIIAEESAEIRKRNEAYDAWAARTNALLPNLLKWQKSPHRYRFLTLYRKQFRYISATIAGFMLINLLKNRIVAFWLHIDYLWLILLAAAFIPYLLARSKPRKAGKPTGNATR